MKKKIQVGAAIVFGLALSLLFSEPVFAENQLNDMTIEVELQEDGSAVITEHREMNMDDGTELYIVLEALQDSELLDFSVAGFEEETDWDSDDSMEEKAGKYGVIDTDSGYELVWGIGQYGANTYDVTYSLSNLVRELEDGQALLWNFDTFSDIPAENLTVEITGPEPFTEDSTRLWGFGFEGDIQLVNGSVVWQAAEEVDNSKDVTVLLQFPSGMFQTQASVDMTLEEQQEMAMDGSAYNEDTSSDVIAMAIIAGVVVLGAGAGGTAIAYGVKVNKAKKEAGQMRSVAERVKENKGVVLDEVPFADKDFAGIAYLLHQMNKGYFEDYFSVYLLKWTMEERIDIQTRKEDKLFGTGFDTRIEILHYQEEREQYSDSFAEMVSQLPLHSEEVYETGLWMMLLDAADETGMVSDERMNRWAKAHAKEVEEYADYLEDYSKDYLEAHNLIAFEDIHVWGSKHEVAKASHAGDELFDRLIQFDHYLEEVELEGFQDTTRRLSIEEYLLWSALYYRSEEITKQFKEMIPDTADYGYSEDYPFVYYYWYWNGMYGFRRNWSSGLASGGFHSAASSAAAGGGGATSFGGGGGAGGGGGGGAR